jgi:RecB family exonuclease
MDPFVEQLAELCRAHVMRNKWVFVPTHALGRTLGERITLSGTNWLNIHFVTPLDIALRMGAPFLVERGIDPSEEGLGPALIMRLLLDLPEEGGYFRPLADQPAMSQALWSTIRELRMAGLDSDALTPEAFEAPAKYAELQALLAAYQRFLATNRRGDMATVYEEALLHRDWCPIQGPDCWTEWPEAVWSPRQRQLLDVMPGERIVPKTLAIPAATVPRRLAGASVERVVPDPAINPLAFLLAPNAERPGPRPVSEVSLFHAGGRETEIDEVFRRVLSSGALLDQVEIACASEAHVSLVWEKALRHEWRVTLGPGIAAAVTRPGRALIGLCDWIETDLSAGHLRQLLQSGDLVFDDRTDGFTAGQAARIIARSDAGWGRATYALALTSVRRGYEDRARNSNLSEDERETAVARVALVSAIFEWISTLIGSIPQPAGGTVPLQDVVEAVLKFVEHASARGSQLDHRAATALSDRIGELRALDAFACPLPQALRFIRERVQSTQVAAERPRPGHLYACTLAQAGLSGRRHIFVVGLEEGRVFPSTAEDAVLLDREREAISVALRSSTDRIDEAVWAVLSRLATIFVARTLPEGPDQGTARVTFSFSCRDTREFRETYALWLTLQAFRLQQGDRSLSYPAMRRALGEPVSRVPATREAATSSGAWWLRTVVGTGDKGTTIVEGAFPDVARGKRAEEARAVEAFSEFDGLVPAAGGLLDPCNPANAFSVTELEGAASCPFRFFLKRGLGLRPVDGRQRDKDVWLDPPTRGSELHDIYATLWRHCRDEKRRPNSKKDGRWLTELVEARLAKLQREMPAATSEIFERESRELLADVELFLESESGDASDPMPIAFEVSFGRPLGEGEEPLASAEPVEISLGSGLTFRIAGRIDRIDQVGPSSFQILDYKTGGFWRDSWKGVFDGGRRLQHALYGLAAVQLLKARYKTPKVTAGIYYFSSHKGRQERVRIPTPSLSQTADVLGALRQVIVNGTFVHAADAKDCKFCDYASACGKRPDSEAEIKRADPTLRVYEKLTSHV